MATKTPPAVDTIAYVDDKHYAWQTPAIYRLQVRYTTADTVACDPLPPGTSAPESLTSAHGRKVVSKRKHMVYPLVDDQAWDRIVQADAQLQIALDALADELTRLGAYAQRLAEAGGPKQAPDPLCPSVIRIDDPATDRHYSFLNFHVPRIQRQKIKGHTPKMLRAADVDYTFAQSDCFVCPDDQAWENVSALWLAAEAAGDRFDQILDEIKAWDRAEAAGLLQPGQAAGQLALDEPTIEQPTSGTLQLGLVDDLAQAVDNAEAEQIATQARAAMAAAQIEAADVAAVDEPPIVDEAEPWPALPAGYFYGLGQQASTFAHAWAPAPTSRVQDRHVRLCGLQAEQRAPKAIEAGPPYVLCGRCASWAQADLDEAEADEPPTSIPLRALAPEALADEQPLGLQLHSPAVDEPGYRAPLQARDLDEAEARALVDRIRSNVESIRADLLQLARGRGWLALGYDTWRACVVAEFGQSQSYLYRQLAAAEIEQDLGVELGSIPESHLRPLQAIPAEQRAEVLARADEIAGETSRQAKHVAQAAAEVITPKRAEPEPVQAQVPGQADKQIRANIDRILETARLARAGSQSRHELCNEAAALARDIFDGDAWRAALAAINEVDNEPAPPSIVEAPAPAPPVTHAPAWLESVYTAMRGFTVNLPRPAIPAERPRALGLGLDLVAAMAVGMGLQPAVLLAEIEARMANLTEQAPETAQAAQGGLDEQPLADEPAPALDEPQAAASIDPAPFATSIVFTPEATDYDQTYVAELVDDLEALENRPHVDAEGLDGMRSAIEGIAEAIDDDSYDWLMLRLGSLELKHGYKAA